jgi:hypothetical protein
VNNSLTALLQNPFVPCLYPAPLIAVRISALLQEDRLITREHLQLPVLLTGPLPVRLRSIDPIEGVASHAA